MTPMGILEATVPEKFTSNSWEKLATTDEFHREAV